jgi:hypothetical protein
MKSLIFLLLLSGTCWAGILAPTVGIHQSTNPQNNANGKSATEIVNEGLCPSGWKESNLTLRDYHANFFDRYVPVEICPDNGLIRVKPEKKL